MRLLVMSMMTDWAVLRFNRAAHHGVGRVQNRWVAVFRQGGTGDCVSSQKPRLPKGHSRPA